MQHHNAIVVLDAAYYACLLSRPKKKPAACFFASRVFRIEFKSFNFAYRVFFNIVHDAWRNGGGQRIF